MAHHPPSPQLEALPLQLGLELPPTAIDLRSRLVQEVLHGSYEAAQKLWQNFYDLGIQASDRIPDDRGRIGLMVEVALIHRDTGDIFQYIFDLLGAHYVASMARLEPAEDILTAELSTLKFVPEYLPALKAWKSQ